MPWSYSSKAMNKRRLALPMGLNYQHECLCPFIRPSCSPARPNGRLDRPTHETDFNADCSRFGSPL
ncbi:hypothetical protein [Moraxella lacunata]|uniref:hypothetical protein n=1 Tax=Moraxella lacunata TaxID=477 RepID=UPI003EE08941